jgi:hypothetical protein
MRDAIDRDFEFWAYVVLLKFIVFGLLFLYGFYVTM